MFHDFVECFYGFVGMGVMGATGVMLNHKFLSKGIYSTTHEMTTVISG